MELGNYKDIEVSDKSVKLKYITGDELWLYISPEADYVNEVTGIKISSDGFIHVKYLGGDFEDIEGEGEGVYFKFMYSKEAMDEVWNYHFNEDYPYILDNEKDDLSWVSEVSSLFYTLLNDELYASRNGHPKYSRLI